MLMTRNCVLYRRGQMIYRKLELDTPRQKYSTMWEERAVYSCCKKEGVKKLLVSEMGQKPEEQLKENFTKQDLKIDGFNSIHYIGERNDGRDTDFKRMKKAVFEELDNINVRSPRQPKIILDMLDVSLIFHHSFHVFLLVK